MADKRVAIGKEGSGTYLTAKLLFEVSEITRREMVAIGTDEALSQLKAEKIDAMFYVAGLPVKLFAEDVQTEDGLALIPIQTFFCINVKCRSSRIYKHRLPWQSSRSCNRYSREIALP